MDVFSKDVVVVPWKSCFNDSAIAAFNARSGELQDFFNAGGDLWMNSSTGDDQYYAVLPSSVLSNGPSISGSTALLPPQQDSLLVSSPI